MPARLPRILPIAVLLLALQACGDSRLKDLSLGINRDSVVVLMGTDTPHRSQSFILEGKFWEILYYGDVGVAAVDSVAWRELSPVVIADGGVVGWGWKYWEREGARLRVELPTKE